MGEQNIIKIGGATGFWGESDSGLPQLLGAGDLDYIVFDYLAEVTLSIMARARAKDASLGYATDFVTAAMAPHLETIAAQGVKIISNAGGVNPKACAAAIRQLIADKGLDLKVGVVTGDDLTARAAEFASAREMFSGEAFPPADKVASINAYLGAFPIAEALAMGADIVITGRCVDSAVTLGACIHEFSWGREAWDKLVAGSLAGHLIECGPQACGGNFTDWHLVGDGFADIGYPIAEISASGDCTITKPSGTGGLVTVGTVGEQMLYEIGDPQDYKLPDVICDFSAVTLMQIGPDRVNVTGATGSPPSDDYKASVTYADGWKIATLWSFHGSDSHAKAERFRAAIMERYLNKLRALNAPEPTEWLAEPIGSDDQLVLKFAIQHTDRRACDLFLKEATGLALSAPPGLSMVAGIRPRATPIVRLFSMLVSKSELTATITVGDKARDMRPVLFKAPPLRRAPQIEPARPPLYDDAISVPLIKLAFARSGDKGDTANIGILPRRPELIPFIWDALTPGAVSYAMCETAPEMGDIHRYFLPGTGAVNLVLTRALGGGGVASLRNDPQGKTYSQLILNMPVPIPAELAETL